MPEGDTIHRTAASLSASLLGQKVLTARTRAGPGLPRVPSVDRLVGRSVVGVEARGKHLLIRFEGGLVLHTHLGMHGSWHRYPPGTAWHRPEAQARAVLEVPGAVAVAFRVTTLELLSERELSAHPRLGRLGPDLAGGGIDLDAAVDRLGADAERSIGEALLDQRLVGGIGNVYRSEVLFLEGVSPLSAVGSLGQVGLRRLVGRARELLRENVDGGPRSTTGRRSPGSRLWVYRRAGRPCRRCGTLITARRVGEHARVVYWCATCQPTSPPTPSPGASSARRPVSRRKGPIGFEDG